MLISGNNYEKINVLFNGNTVVTMSDEEVSCAENYTIRVLEPNMLVHAGDYLYYDEDPERLYMVTEADKKFFTIYELIEEDGSVRINSTTKRRYPNSPLIATLSDYYLVKLKRTDNH